MWACLAKVPLPDFKQENIGHKTFNYVFISYIKNSLVYRFVSLNDFSISGCSDAEFFKHVFHLKKNDSTTVHETIPVHDNSSVRILVEEPRRNMRPRVEASFGPDFLTNILIKDLMLISYMMN